MVAVLLKYDVLFSIDLMMETVNDFKTSASFCNTARRNILDYFTLDRVQASLSYNGLGSLDEMALTRLRYRKEINQILPF